MTIQIEYETERKLEIPYEKLAEKVASHILELEECPYEISVNLVITDNEEIRKVNAEFRLIDAPTDVLSFPMMWMFPCLMWPLSAMPAKTGGTNLFSAGQVRKPIGKK